MMSGLLTGTFDRSRLASDDWRLGSPYFNGEFFEKALRFVSGLADIASGYGKTVAQLAIAWVLSHPEVTSAIVGARNPGQVEEIAGGAGWALQEEDLAKIESLSEKIFGDEVFTDL
jgi:aryl-alcohol dehydrogenase-like predicted oxidoreductase